MTFIKKEQAIAEMMQYCDENNIKDFASLSRYCRENNSNWFRHICNEDVARIMVDYLKDRQ